MKSALPLGLLFLLGGCVYAEVELPFDDDGDGLLLEEDWGCDPCNPDSDSDGHLDGSEVDAGADPTDPGDHPYTGGWPLDECRFDIQGEGYTEGQIVAGFSIPDQYDEDVKIHSFCQHAVLLEVSGFS